MSLWNKPFDNTDAVGLGADNLRALPGLSALWAADAVLVALSGGPDSMALCALMSRLYAAGRGPALHAVTVDHALRDDSAAEAAQVGAYLAGWPGVTHTILRRDDVAPGRVMERARHDRYALLAAYARRHGLSCILTAHHRDDQAETFLMRLAAGSGLDGLAAMTMVTAYGDDLSLIRPLLPWGKAALVAYCDANTIPYVTDPSNANAAFARPRLRAALTHLAPEGLSPSRLARTAHRLQTAKDALDHYAQAAFDAARIAQTAAHIVLDFKKLAAEPCETRRRVLLLAVQILGGSSVYGPRRGRLEDLEVALFDPAPFTRATLGGFLFARDDKAGHLTITRE